MGTKPRAERKIESWRLGGQDVIGKIVSLLCVWLEERLTMQVGNR